VSPTVGPGDANVPSPPDPVGTELVRRFQRGDNDAFAALFERSWPSVHAVVRSTVRDPGEAEDLTQEVFARAFTGLRGYRDTGRPVEAYLVEIARNLLRDRWRRRQGRPLEVSADRSDVGEVVADIPAPDAVMEVAEGRLALSAALGRLPDQYRTVLHQRVVEGRSAEEVGALFGLNANALRQLQHRALRALRAEMGHAAPGADDATGGRP
jgi:RNA polymerase sigma-70 factor (ECF subfamily)